MAKLNIPKSMPQGERVKLENNVEVIFVTEPKELSKISIQKATKFINDLVDEYTYIATKHRKKMKDISRLVKKNISLVRKGQCVFIYALHYNDKGVYKIVGKIMIIRETEKMDHIANLWVGVRKGFRGFGLGKVLLKKGMHLTKKLRGVKIVELGVQENNKRAIKMYKNFGFVVVGKLPHEFQWQPEENKKMQYLKEYIMHNYIKKM